MAKKPARFHDYHDLTEKQQAKFRAVMREYAKGTLRSSSGAKVTSRAQGLAIAFSEARRLN